PAGLRTHRARPEAAPAHGGVERGVDAEARPARLRRGSPRGEVAALRVVRRGATPHGWSGDQRAAHRHPRSGLRVDAAARALAERRAGADAEAAPLREALPAWPYGRFAPPRYALASCGFAPYVRPRRRAAPGTDFGAGPHSAPGLSLRRRDRESICTFDIPR